MKFDPTAKAFEPKNDYQRQHGLLPPKVSDNGLQHLSVDVITNILHYLDTSELLAVAGTSRGLRQVVIQNTIPGRIREIIPKTLSNGFAGYEVLYKTARNSLTDLSMPQRLFRLEIINNNKATFRFSNVAEAAWSHKAMPVIKADDCKLVLACGNELWSSFDGGDWVMEQMGRSGIGDISDLALTQVQDEVVASFVDGRIERIKLAASQGRRGDTHKTKLRYTSEGSAIEAIDYSCDQDRLLYVTQDGQMVLSSTTQVALGARPWCTSFVDKNRRIATGARAQRPLLIHNLGQAGITFARSYAATSHHKSSVFAIESLGANLILSGWYDGLTRLYDLRCGDSNPVSSWQGPYDDAAIYSLACSGSSLYAGSALNSVVHSFDLRSPKPGISVFLNKTERCPVYSIVAEHERVFGALEHSVHGLDFYHVNAIHTGRSDWIGSAQGSYYVHHKDMRLLYSLNA